LIELFHLFALASAIACSVLVLRLKDLLSSAVCLGAVGFFISCSYFALRAPDLGVVQMVTEVIKTCILVLVVAKTHRVAVAVEPRRIRMLVALSLALALLIFAAFVAPALSPFGGEAPELVSKYADSGRSETGSSNLVTAILLGFRAYDTLGEVCVLFVSILGIAVVTKKVKEAT